MASSTISDTERMSTSDLRRRLTMPAGEASRPEVPEPETDSKVALRAAVKPTVSHHTPTPREALRPREILRPGGPVALAAEPKAPAVPNLDMFFPEAAQDRRVQDSGSDDLHQVRAENNDLRELLDEMRHLLQEANEGEVRFKAEMEQKNAEIAEMRQMMQQFEEQLSGIQEPPKAKNADELEEWADELERENTKLAQMRRDLDADRRQMKQDEQELQKQMRDMEVGMAKERAVMARQETELRRLNSEIQQELDLMQRGDPGLRQQMSMFQRRHQDILARGGVAPAAPMSHAPQNPGPPMAQPIDSSAAQLPEAKPTDSGMFRRMFKK